MPMSNYPNGFKDGVSIRGVPLAVTHPGRVFFVNSTSVLAEGGLGGSNGNDGSYLRPYATIDYAIGKCKASRGDVVFVMPGHTEDVAAASGIDVDVAGVAVIGLGRGALRPTLNCSATTSTITVAASSCLLHNLLITGGIDEVASPVVVSGADCELSSLELRDVTGQMTDGVLTTDAAIRLKILDHIHDGAAAAGTNAAIAIVGGKDIEITAERIAGDFAVGGIDVRTTATTGLLVHDILFFETYNAADICIVDTITASTGQMGPNIYMMLKQNAGNVTEAITGATFRVMDVGVHVVNLVNEKSLAINWTASTDA